MAKTKRELILTACVLSGIATVLNLVSLGTQEWVSATLTDKDEGKASYGSAKYGLFGGYFSLEYPWRTTYKLKITCVMSENKCAFMSGSEDYRTSTLKDIINGHKVSAEVCPSDEDEDNSPQMMVRDYIRMRSLGTDSTMQDNYYILGGVVVTTVLFLIIAAIMGLVASGLSVWNATSNPVQVYFNIFGLYIYNAVAGSMVFLTMVTWGTEFGSALSDDIACCWTLVQKLNQSASLGYSYWILLPSFFLYIGSIAVLFTRDHLLNKEPTVNVNLEGEADPGIYLY